MASLQRQTGSPPAFGRCRGSRKGKSGTRTYHANMGLIRNYIIPFIGDYAISEIDTPFLMKYYTDLQKHKAVPGNHHSDPGYISARTVRDINKILSPAFRYAVFLKLIPSNPASDLKLPKTENTHIRSRLIRRW